MEFRDPAHAHPSFGMCDLDSVWWRILAKSPFGTELGARDDGLGCLEHARVEEVDLPTLFCELDVERSEHSGWTHVTV